MSSEPVRFYSNGKLLLTGEYLVMYGAESLALPVKFGQEMKVYPIEKPLLKWDAFIGESPWFEAEFKLPGIELISFDIQKKALFLQTALLAAKKANALFLTEANGFVVQTRLNYPQQWGLGSSSTFIYNLAAWAEADAIELHRSMSGGSGYDIACAGAENPILYQIKDGIPEWKLVNYRPAYHNHIFFVYLGEKQNTMESVRLFKKNYKIKTGDIDFVSDLTRQLLNAEDLNQAIKVLETHESFMGNLLNIVPLKHRMFPDFDGAVKSLGAWGGDFAMVVSPLDQEEIKNYFILKGFHTLFNFEELVLKRSSNKKN